MNTELRVKAVNGFEYINILFQDKGDKGSHAILYIHDSISELEIPDVLKFNKGNIKSPENFIASYLVRLYKKSGNEDFKKLDRVENFNNQTKVNIIYCNDVDKKPDPVPYMMIDHKITFMDSIQVIVNGKVNDASKLFPKNEIINDTFDRHKIDKYPDWIAKVIYDNCITDGVREKFNVVKILSNFEKEIKTNKNKIMFINQPITVTRNRSRNRLIGDKLVSFVNMDDYNGYPEYYDNIDQICKCSNNEYISLCSNINLSSIVTRNYDIALKLYIN